MKQVKKKLIVIVGPTASGKSELAVTLAKKLNGEIISVDSRQIYRGLNIGSGKIQGRWKGQAYSYKQIPHWGIDIANPKYQYSVAKFKQYADKVIQNIYKRGKIPILCGGSAHWIDAIVFNQSMPNVKPQPHLRKKLEHKSTDQLLKLLTKQDPLRAQNIDKYNRRRIIRALEIISVTNKPIPRLKTTPKYETLWIGLKPPQHTLYKKIEQRLKARLKNGLVKEVISLHKTGLSWRKLEQFGLEYRFTAWYLQNKLTKEAFYQQLLTAIKHYSKRQFTWWKKNQTINWFESSSKVKLSEVKKQLSMQQIKLS